MISTLLGRSIREVGPKKAARSLGYSLGYTYALARDPADPEHPDNTGTERCPYSRLESLWETMAAYPHLRPLLVEWRLDLDALFRRLLDRDDPTPATDAVVIADAARCAKEAGEAVASAITRGAEAGEWGEALGEVTEAIDALEELARAIRRRMEREPAGAAIPLRRAR